MMKKIVHIILWMFLLAWFGVIMGFVSRRTDAVLCNRMDIIISDSATVRFVTRGQVRAMIKESGFEVQGYPVGEINTREMEHALEENPYVRNAEIYTTVEGAIKIQVQQRTPLLRMMPGGDPGYYVDKEGYILPLAEGFTPRVFLVSGNIYLPDSIMQKGQVTVLSEKTSGIEKEFQTLLAFARYVEEHPFWKNQVVQIYRDYEGNYELIPRVGAHQILLGSLAGYQTKLRNLKLLYDQGFSRHGWNKYDQINLKYSNQVICKKR